MVRGPDHPAPAPLTRTAAEPAPGPSANRLRALLAPGRRRTTLLFRTATFAGLVIVYGASTWLPTLMVDSGYDLSSSLEFSIAFNVGAVLGTLAAAVVADRGFLKAATVTSFLCAAVAMITLSTPQPRPVLLLASAVAGCGALGTQALVDITSPTPTRPGCAAPRSASAWGWAGSAPSSARATWRRSPSWSPRRRRASTPSWSRPSWARSSSVC
ncbi:MFS transporter [Streptomyces albidoflavus]